MGRDLYRLLSADLVITDRLAPVGLLARLGPDVEIIDAAPLPGRATLSSALSRCQGFQPRADVYGKCLSG